MVHIELQQDSLVRLNSLIQTWGDAPQMALSKAKRPRTRCADLEDQIDDAEGVPSASNIATVEFIILTQILNALNAMN